MIEAEFFERIAALETKKRGLERNRNICVLLLALLSYGVGKETKQGNPPVWFYLAMGAILLTLAVLAFTGHRLAIKTAFSIQKLKKESDTNHKSRESENSENS